MSDSELAAPLGYALLCPFCGDEAIERHSAIVIGGINAYEFRCFNYQCAVSQTGSNRKDALAKWNSRHNAKLCADAQQRMVSDSEVSE